MNRIFDLENPVFRMFSRIADAVLLNVLWLLSCVPVVTIGAATAALYETFRVCVVKGEGALFHTYMAVIKRKLGRNIAASLVYEISAALFIGVIIYGYMYLNGRPWLGGLYLFAGLLFVIGVSMALYTFLLLSNSPFEPFKRAMCALTLSLRFLPATLLMLILSLGGVILLDFFPVSIVLLPSLWCFLIFKPVEKVVNRVPHLVIREEIL